MTTVEEGKKIGRPRGRREVKRVSISFAPAEYEKLKEMSTVKQIAMSTLVRQSVFGGI